MNSDSFQECRLGMHNKCNHATRSINHDTTKWRDPLMVAVKQNIFDGGVINSRVVQG